MDSPSAPQTPDPVKTAAAQGVENANAARLNTTLNRPDQITPYGSLHWRQSPGARTFNEQRYNDALKNWQLTQQSQQSAGQGAGHWEGYGGEGSGSATWVPDAPAAGAGAGGPGAPDRNADQFYDQAPGDKWTSEIELDPRVQQLLDAQLATSQKLNTSVDNSLGQVNQMFSRPAPMADAGVRQKTEDALFGRYKRTLDPQFEQARERLRSQQMNRGMVEGSEGFNRLVDAFGRQENDAYDQARTSSIVGGGDEMARQLGLEQQSRMGSINELSALRSGTQAQMPSFSSGASGSTVNPAPFAQSAFNAYQGQLGQYNADVGSNNAMLGGLAGLGGSLLSAGSGSFGASLLAALPAFSDRRLKSNIVKVGHDPRGFGIYEYDIFGKRQRGVMADEIEQVIPEAVSTHDSGFKMVDYGRI